MSAYASERFYWFRFGDRGPGLLLNGREPSFSERNGLLPHATCWRVPLPFGWRLFGLHRVERCGL